MRRYLITITVLILSAVFLIGCGGSKTLPIDGLKEEFKDIPDYSIILDDMEERGNFSKKYYHKYRIIQDEKNFLTDWKVVPKDYYASKATFLGMTLASKEKGVIDETAAPPGYDRVGNERYGNWQRDSNGNSFWAFYGQYMFMSHLLGGNRVYRNDYNNYRTARGSGQPYYGSNKQYGTRGSVTKSTKPNFYARQKKRAAASKQRFRNNASRTGRSRSGYSSRSSSFGK
jgi:hypothetical protein